MPPQQGSDMIVDGPSSGSTKNDPEPVSPGSAGTNDGNEMSYWDAPVERSLRNKTLSTLDMMVLESNHPDEKKEEKDDYWEAPIESSLRKKTLSTLDMSMLESNHPDVKEKLPERNNNDSGKEGNDSDLTTDATSEEDLTCYWDDAPIDKSLQGKTLSKIEISEMNKQHPDEPEDKKKESTHPYWDWKLKENMNNMKKTLSNLSLRNLRKGSKRDVFSESDEVLDRTRGASRGRGGGEEGTSSKESGGPITKKTHKLRDSWKKSFQKLSTNSLAGLDESGGSRGSAARSSFRIFKSRNGLDLSSSSYGSQSSHNLEF